MSVRKGILPVSQSLLLHSNSFIREVFAYLGHRTSLHMRTILLYILVPPERVLMNQERNKHM